MRAEERAVDTRRLAEMLGEPSLLDEVLESFLADCDEALQTLAAAGASDPERARRAAHTLKGIAAQVGAQTLCELAARAESACTGADSGVAFALRARISAEVDRVRAELGAER